MTSLELDCSPGLFVVEPQACPFQHTSPALILLVGRPLQWPYANVRIPRELIAPLHRQAAQLLKALQRLHALGRDIGPA